VVYGISDINPPSIHLTVPSSARLRRRTPKSVIVHQGDLKAEDIIIHEGIPVTTVSRTISDLLVAGGRADLIRHAITEARHEGFIRDTQARQLRRRVDSHLKARRLQREPVSV
jgi:predicted transcriptional regulator of viral defense system